MDIECLAIIETLSALSSDNEEQICLAINVVKNYLHRLSEDKRHFRRVYVAVCTKLFELTCRLPYQSMSWIVYVGVSSDVINTLCACLATSR